MDRLNDALDKILVSLLLIAIGAHAAIADSTATTDQQWQPLSDIVSPAQLNDIIRENASGQSDQAMIAQSATGYQKGDFIAVTFHNQDFCGRGGCWVFGYQPSAEETIFRTLVATSVGPNGPIVELIDKNLEVPCVRWFAYDSIPLTEPVDGTACYRGDAWVPEP